MFGYQNALSSAGVPMNNNKYINAGSKTPRREKEENNKNRDAFARRKTMSNVCSICGSTESQAIAGARALGFEQEFQSGAYTCCQIAKWSEEQRAAWLEAANECSNSTSSVVQKDEMTPPDDTEATDAALVPVRLRRPRVSRPGQPGWLA